MPGNETTREYKSRGSEARCGDFPNPNATRTNFGSEFVLVHSLTQSFTRGSGSQNSIVNKVTSFASTSEYGSILVASIGACVITNCRSEFAPSAIPKVTRRTI